MSDGKTRKKGRSVLEKRKAKHERRAARDAANARRDRLQPQGS
ncbi:hypothetical protein [Actinomarinicola tropica]|nr:hypothetical protein [Actinomarinicola tropica]